MWMQIILGHLGHLLLLHLLLLYSFNSPLITYATNLRYGCVCIHTFVHWGLRGHLHLIGFDQISGCSLDSRSTQHEQEYQDQLPKSICCVISVCSTSIPGCPADEWTTSRTSKQVASWQINMGQTTLHSRLDCWCTTLDCYFLIWSKVKLHKSLYPFISNCNFSKFLLILLYFKCCWAWLPL